MVLKSDDSTTVCGVRLEQDGRFFSTAKVAGGQQKKRPLKRPSGNGLSSLGLNTIAEALRKAGS